MKIFITAGGQYSVLLDFLSACNITATHSQRSVTHLCEFVSQCRWRDPVFSLGPDRREARSASHRSFSLFFYSPRWTSVRITLPLFLVLSFNNSSQSLSLSALSGDPQAADRPAVIAVFKTRTNPIFELLPWFVLSCVVAFHICVALVELKSTAFSQGSAPAYPVCMYWMFLVFLCFSGFVQGEPGAEPRLMQFHPNFQHGALLTVVSLTL